MANGDQTRIRTVNISRRGLLKAGGLCAAALAGGSLLTAAPRASSVANHAAPPEDGNGKQPYTQYRFRIEESELAFAGPATPALLVNGAYPGTQIRVTEGDLLRITVENALKEPTSIHWHGLLLPAPMDGVPGVSQAPIPPGQVYVYEYPVRQTGTYWYHSHYELQEQQGLSGPFIVDAKDEPLTYDQEYVIILGDWLYSDPYQIIPNLRKGGMKKAQASPRNTAGVSDFDVDVNYDTTTLNGRTSDDPRTCQGRPGERIRFRIINGSASTFFRLMIDGHALKVIHADGNAVRPVDVDNLIIATAERYDVIVQVGASGSYTMHAIALGEGGGVVGVLHTPDAKPVASDKTPAWGPRKLTYADLEAPAPTTLPDGPVKEIQLALGGNMAKYLWSMGGQYYPTSFVPDGKADQLLINEGDRVRVELVNDTRMAHPMHLHGHFYRLLHSHADDPHAPLKDTVAVYPKETVKFEFFADNPGRWFFHCHNLYHLETGMAREVQYVV